MRIAFELSDKDIRYFRSVLKKVRKGDRSTDEDVVLRESAALLKEVKASEPPEFVLERMDQLGKLIDMLEDDDWRLEGEDRMRVLNALAYFADPDDLIPDRVPGLGYLDDAIMVQLVVTDLKHEIEAYDAFCEYRQERRKERAATPELLEQRRTALQARMRRRRRSDRERHARKRGKSPISLW